MKFDKRIIILCLILLLCILFRFYRFDNPIADWHSWRQSDTAAVSRNFAQNGFDLLHPRMDNLSNVQSGLDNPEGYFFVEFPLYNAAQAGLFVLFGGLTIEQWGRIVTIFSSTLATLFLYLIVRRHSNETIGLMSAFFYACLPFSIYYGRVILADTSMVMATLGGIYFFDLWIDARNKKQESKGKTWMFYFLAILFTAAALLLKPSAIFFVFPMIYLAWRAFGLGLILRWELWLFAAMTIAPLGWWRTWMTQFPEGIPANAWLFNGNGIRFRPSFFRWIFYERLTVLISGYALAFVAGIGLLTIRKIKEWLFFVSFFVGSLLYVCVFATGNVQHDYYQIPLLPSVAIALGIGGYFLSHQVIKLKAIKYPMPIGMIIFFVCTIVGFWISWDHVKDYFNINNRSMIIAGKAVDQLTPKDAKVIADYNGDSSFLYQTNRKGWASLQDPLPIMIEKGASYLVLVNPTEADYAFAKEYTIIAETKEYLLYELKNK